MFPVRQVRKDERRYYEEVLAYSRSGLLLYPYHLSDIMVEGLRVTPFQYYTSVLESIMDQERSYDSLPNFTAADCESWKISPKPSLQKGKLWFRTKNQKNCWELGTYFENLLNCSKHTYKFSPEQTTKQT